MMMDTSAQALFDIADDEDSIFSDILADTFESSPLPPLSPLSHSHTHAHSQQFEERIHAQQHNNNTNNNTQQMPQAYAIVHDPSYTIEQLSSAQLAFRFVYCYLYCNLYCYLYSASGLLYC